MAALNATAPAQAPRVEVILLSTDHTKRAGIASQDAHRLGRCGLQCLDLPLKRGRMLLPGLSWNVLLLHGRRLRRELNCS